MVATSDPEAPPTAGDRGRFHTGRRKDLRSARPWHPLRHIIRELPAAIEQAVEAMQIGDEATVVDYGCADVPYRGLFPPGATYIAADLPGNPQATVAIDPGGTLPVEDSSADVVVSTQVLEHVADPAVYLREAARVLRPGGRLLLSTHGIMVYHPDPVDLWRWTSAGLREAVEGAGFRVVRFEGVMGLAATGIQLVQDATYARLPRWPRALFALVMQFLVAAADRLQPAAERRMNALVFVLVAVRR